MFSCSNYTDIKYRDTKGDESVSLISELFKNHDANNTDNILALPKTMSLTCKCTDGNSIFLFYSKWTYSVFLPTAYFNTVNILTSPVNPRGH